MLHKRNRPCGVPYRKAGRVTGKMRSSSLTLSGRVCVCRAAQRCTSQPRQAMLFCLRRTSQSFPQDTKPLAGGCSHKGNCDIVRG